MARPSGIETINPAELARCLFEESGDALFVFDPDKLSVIDVNPGAQKLTGLSRQQLRSRSIGELLRADSPALLNELFESCHATRLFHSREAYQLERAGGETLEVNVSVTRLHTKPKVLGLVSVRDVSARRAAEQGLRAAQAELRATLDAQASHLEAATRELRASELRYRTIVETTQEWIWECDSKGRLTFSNQAVENILGHKGEALLGLTIVSLIDEEDRERMEQAWRESRDGAQGWSSRVARFRHRDGTPRFLESEARPVLDDTGQVIGYRGADRDITARLAAEEARRAGERELAHASRLSTMGEMAAGIAHEINQPLSAITNFSDATLRLSSQGSEERDLRVTDWVTQIRRQAIRCGEIIRRLRRFARKEGAERSAMDIAGAIHDSLSILGGVLRQQDVLVELDLPADEVIVHANATELQQVLVNLIRNACDAMSAAQVKRPNVRIESELQGETLRLLIRDNGPGIDEQAKSRLFDPFFSTKSDGMGMGLAISRSIVHNHKGRLWVVEDGTPGGCFGIELPLSNPDSPASVPGDLDRAS